MGLATTFCSWSEAPVWPWRPDSTGERAVEAAGGSLIWSTSLRKLKIYAPPNGRWLGDKLLLTKADARLVSDWLLFGSPCRFGTGLGSKVKVLALENPPKAAFCIKLPLWSWTVSSFPFLPRGGNSSIFPVWGCPVPDNCPTPPWPPWR